MLLITSSNAFGHAFVEPAQADCKSITGRIVGLKYLPTTKALTDFSIEVAKNQERNLMLSDVTMLEGPCASDVYAFRMAQIVFKDGAIFTANSSNQFAYLRVGNGFTKLGVDLAPSARMGPERNRLIMTSTVTSAGSDDGKRSLDVGLSKTDDTYIIAAYIRYGNRAAAPVELVRSTQPIRSVTYFPSPDSNSGKLGILRDGSEGVVLISLGWDHATLSQALTSEK